MRRGRPCGRRVSCSESMWIHQQKGGLGDTDRCGRGRGLHARPASPIAAVQLLAAIADIGNRRAGPLRIIGAAVTGAGRKLAGAVVGADLVLDGPPLTPARPAPSHPDVDTIIEIGGQDSKFTTLKDGRVKFWRYGHGLRSRNGGFIEEQAQKLGRRLEDYARPALDAPSQWRATDAPCSWKGTSTTSCSMAIA